MWVNIIGDWVKTSDVYRITSVSGHPEFKQYKIYFTDGSAMTITEEDYPRSKLLEKMHIRTECYDDF
jgi:hypothetical protein